MSDYIVEPKGVYKEIADAMGSVDEPVTSIAVINKCVQDGKYSATTYRRYIRSGNKIHWNIIRLGSSRGAGILYPMTRPPDFGITEVCYPCYVKINDMNRKYDKWFATCSSGPSIASRIKGFFSDVYSYLCPW